MASYKKAYFPQVDILRGMAVLMVVLYHSIIVYPLNLHEIAWCRELHLFLWTLQMPVFFMISGFCFGRGKGGFGYFISKFKRIFVPHIFFSLLDILPRVIKNPMVNEGGEDLSGTLKELILYGGNDWFLLTLFIIMCLFPALDILLCPEGLIKGKRAALTGLICLMLFIFNDRIPDIFCLNMAAGYTIYFYLGYLIRKETESRGSFSETEAGEKPALIYGLWNKRGPALYIISLIGAVITYFFYRQGGRYIKRVWELIFFLPAAFILTAAASSLKNFSGLPGALRELFALCGRWSLQIFLMDPYCLVLTRTILVSLLGLSSPVLIIPGNFIPDTALALIITLFILRRWKILRFISGIPQKEQTT